MITHIEWGESHCCSIARDIRPVVLSGWCPIVLKLHCLIGHISSRCSYRITNISITFFSTSWCYCEKTDKDTVVEDTSISLSITSTDNT